MYLNDACKYFEFFQNNISKYSYVVKCPSLETPEIRTKDKDLDTDS
jgi:hypothetical protein